MDGSNYAQDFEALSQGSYASHPNHASLRQAESKGASEQSFEQSQEIAEIKQILEGDLSPNKRAIIETLIYTWESAHAAHSSNSTETPTTLPVEKKKREHKRSSESYPDWHVAFSHGMPS
jgi:hypothetical protein